MLLRMLRAVWLRAQPSNLKTLTCLELARSCCSSVTAKILAPEAPVLTTTSTSRSRPDRYHICLTEISALSKEAISRCDKVSRHTFSYISAAAHYSSILALTTNGSIHQGGAAHHYYCLEESQ